MSDNWCILPLAIIPYKNIHRTDKYYHQQITHTNGSKRKVMIVYVWCVHSFVSMTSIVPLIVHQTYNMSYTDVRLLCTPLIIKFGMHKIGHLSFLFVKSQWQFVVERNSDRML